MTNVNVFFFALLLGLLGMPKGAFGQVGPVPSGLPHTYDFVMVTQPDWTPDDFCYPLSPSNDGCFIREGFSERMPLEEDMVLVGGTTQYKPFEIVLEGPQNLRLRVVPTRRIDNFWTYYLTTTPSSFHFITLPNQDLRIMDSEGRLVMRFGFSPNPFRPSHSEIYFVHLACKYTVSIYNPWCEEDDAENRLIANPTNNDAMLTTTSKKQSANSALLASWTVVNPLSDNLVLTFDAPLPAATLVQVYNMNGGLVHREVVAADATQVTLTAAHWTPGVYAVSINQAGGSQQKLVVKQ